MDIEEADKIIANFMGRKIIDGKLVEGLISKSPDAFSHYLSDPYSKDLNKLVPVWQVLGLDKDSLVQFLVVCTAKAINDL